MSLEISIQLFSFPFLFSYIFSMWSVLFLCLPVVVSMHRYYLEYWQDLFLLFFFTHTVCPSHLWDVCILCVVTSFLVLWSVCWSSFLVYFKNGPDYFTKRTALVCISLMRFLLCSLVSRSHFLWVLQTNVSWWSKWCLNDSRPLQVSMTILRILADLNNVVVSIVSILLFFLNSSWFYKPLRSFSSVSITNDVAVNHFFFLVYQIRMKYLSIFSVSLFTFYGPLKR